MDDEIKYIEGLVPKKYADMIEDMVSDQESEFNWYFSDNSAKNESLINDYLENFANVDNRKDLGQFIKVLFHNSNNEEKPYIDEEYFSKFETIIWFLLDKFEDLDVKSLVRAKVNFIYNPNPDDTVEWMQDPHVDNSDSTKVSLLYYINDCDGDTILFNERYDDMKEKKPLTERIRFTPKKGDAILFKSDIFHCALLPVLKDRRYIINFIFELLTEKDKEIIKKIEEEELRELQL